MAVAFYRSMWGPMGFDGDISGLAAICAETERRGYAGIETNPLLWGDNVDEARRIVADHGLAFLARAHTFGASVDDHVGWVRRCVETSQPFGTPHVIVQPGSDAWDDRAVDEFFTATAAIEAASGIRLAHESHRGKILNTPWNTARVLDRFPELWLAADYSHWVVVCERYLDTEADLLARFAPRVVHIDARVSTPQQIQVADPRTEHGATAAFVAFWDDIHSAGALTTVVPEFGPAPYEPSDAADRDDVCQWVADHLRARWA